MEATQNDENSLSQSQTQPQTLLKNAQKKLLKQQRYEAKKAEKKAHRGSVSALSPAKLVLIELFNGSGNRANWRLKPESHGIVNALVKPNLSSIALFAHNDAISNHGFAVYENGAVFSIPQTQMSQAHVCQIFLPFNQQLLHLILVHDLIHDWQEGDLALNPGVALEKHNVLRDFHFPCPYLSLSLSLSL